MGNDEIRIDFIIGSGWWMSGILVIAIGRDDGEREIG